MWLSQVALTRKLAATQPELQGGFIEDFFYGLQANSFIDVCDVGPGKEAADAKLQGTVWGVSISGSLQKLTAHLARLLSHLRFPSVRKIILGVSHDKGYCRGLEEAVVRGYKDKLMILDIYNDIEAEHIRGDMRALIEDRDNGFPKVYIPNLFRPRPIGYEGTAGSGSADQNRERSSNVEPSTAGGSLEGRQCTPSASRGPSTAPTPPDAPRKLSYAGTVGDDGRGRIIVVSAPTSQAHSRHGSVAPEHGRKRVDDLAKLNLCLPEVYGFRCLNGSCGKEHPSQRQSSPDLIMAYKAYVKAHVPCRAWEDSQLCGRGEKECWYSHQCPHYCTSDTWSTCPLGLARRSEEIQEIVDNEKRSQAMLKEVQRELSISKRAFTSLEAENATLRAEKIQLERLRDDLSNQLKPCRIAVLIDGDGAIFDVDLIAEGQSGGHKAASMLSESIKQQFPGRPHLEISVYAFFNQYGLAMKFGRISKHEAKNRLGEFMTGFNQASERFIIADVGYTKEGADAKIKGFLDAELRLPQTEKIIFGGCHDNGYVTALRSHITSGYKHKLMLLQSYDEIASGIKDLDLPVLWIPGLFMAGNLDALQTPAIPPSDLPSGTATTGIPGPVPSTPRKRGGSRVLPEKSEVGAGQTIPSPIASPPGARPVDRSLPPWAQRPPACLLYYISPTAELDALRDMAKTMPCATVAKGNRCTWGEACMYGHKCRYLDKCKYAKNGKCKFKGPTMHLPDSALGEI
ncbi:hypothetical protein NMY22_g8104 [Coprinellus aureogranulatus]|nr:hypothetical protein NMY22_g8104 [Coprinellus aureogranulatus]